jgi:hypothetical protein
MASNTEKLDAMVLCAIKSYTPDRPAMLGDLWAMVLVRRACGYGLSLQVSLQRLKKAGKIKYSRKPAGWVAT